MAGTMGSFKVIISGGGLAGALLANGLNNNSVDFMMYERDPPGSKKEGYQIRLGPGAQAGFGACLSEAHIGKITAKLGRSSGSQATAPSLHNTQFVEILDMGLLPKYTKSAAISRVVLRDILLKPIKKSGRIQYGKAVEGYEVVTQKDGQEKVRVHFSDGSQDICDILVGADGVNSKINKQVGLRNIHVLDNYWAFLSKGSIPYDGMMMLPPKLRQSPILVISKDIGLYYALYLPEADAARKSNRGSEEKDALQFNEAESSYYWGLNIPVDTLPYKKASEIQNHKEICLRAIKDWAPEFHQMLSIGEDDSEEAGIFVTQLRASTRPEKDWRQRVQKTGTNYDGHHRVWMIGDAIHAMQPNRGQGGNQALADCADILPQLLKLNSLASTGLAHPTTEDIRSACDAYESVMIPRAFEWVRKSGGLGYPCVDLDGVLGVLVRLAARLILPLLKLYYTIFTPSNDE